MHRRNKFEEYKFYNSFIHSQIEKSKEKITISKVAKEDKLSFFMKALAWKTFTIARTQSHTCTFSFAHEKTFL